MPEPTPGGVSTCTRTVLAARVRPANARIAEPLERFELVLVDAERADSRLQRLTRYAEHRRRPVRTRHPAPGRRERRLDLFALSEGGVLCIDIPLQPRLIDREDVAVIQDHGSLDDVLQLADVSRPVVGRQELESPPVDLPDLLPGRLCVALNQIFDQQPDVVRPLA